MDLTHEGWRKELREKLTEAGDGFYRLKEEYREAGAGKWADLSPEFVVTGEISSVYKKNGKTRKVHNVVVFPDLESADRLACQTGKNWQYPCRWQTNPETGLQRSGRNGKR